MHSISDVKTTDLPKIGLDPGIESQISDFKSQIQADLPAWRRESELKRLEQPVSWQKLRRKNRRCIRQVFFFAPDFHEPNSRHNPPETVSQPADECPGLLSIGL